MRKSEVLRNASFCVCVFSPQERPTCHEEAMFEVLTNKKNMKILEEYLSRKVFKMKYNTNSHLS